MQVDHKRRTDILLYYYNTIKKSLGFYLKKKSISRVPSVVIYAISSKTKRAFLRLCSTELMK